MGHGVLRDAAAATCVRDDKIITIIITLTVPLLIKVHLQHWRG
jgi:hypothetical protein